VGYFGERLDPAVWCARPGGEHVRSQAEREMAIETLKEINRRGSLRLDGECSE
jgi:hypothetical protein